MCFGFADLFAYENDGEQRFSYRGCIGAADGLTFDELQGVFESLADLFPETM